MTTLTSRPLPLLPLTLPPPMTCNERSSSNGSVSPSSSIMHPDNLMLQGHGVTSPRLCSSASSASSGMYGKNCESPPISGVNDFPGQNLRSPLRYPINRSDPPNDSFNKMRSSAGDSDVTSANLDDNDDRLSCCSEDSELSVGQECCDNNDSEQNLVTKINSNISISSNKSIGRNSGMIDECESVDNSSNVSDENRPTPSAVEAVAVDDVSDESNQNIDVDSVMMTAAAAAAIRVPPIIRPSPTRLQEEFLRKSHLYAEELMKQQMQFMAAARASAFSTLRHGNVNADIGKIGFRPPNALNENLVNFSGIHSHLNAISKMSSQLGNGNSSAESALSKLTAFGLSTSREPSQSPPSFNPLHPHLSHHYPMHPNPQHHQFINNNINDSNLKFSIDNILKADFGRRITDPLLKRVSGNYSSASGNAGGGGGGGNKVTSNRKTHNRSQADGNSDKHGAPIDLTNVMPHPSVANNNNNNNSIVSLEKQPTPVPIPPPQASNAAQSSQSSASSTTSSSSSSSSSTTSSSASSTSESSGSGGPMVWPAWVYCTRYSDRPSSGRSPRTRKPKKPPGEKGGSSSSDEKRPRTAFSGPQLARLKHEFSENRYLTERRRQQLSAELGLNEAQIKIWFQNKRAKIKKSSGTKNPLALQLMAQGLYNHSTVPLTREEEELQELQAKGGA